MEGGYCLFVLAFIIGGAVLREVNLLVLLAGLLSAPFLWSWLWGRLSLSQVELYRVADDRVFAGEPLLVRWGISTGRWNSPAWGIVIEERWRRSRSSSRRGERTRLVIPQAWSGRTTWESYGVVFAERGELVCGPATVSTRFPLGLFESSRSMHQTRPLTVWPARGKLTPAWHHLLQRLRIGQEVPLARRGMSDGDYYGLREWRPGDSLRWIHWRTSARLDTLTVREFQQQRDESLALLVDLHDPGEEGAAAAERVLSFVATVVEDRRRHRLPIQLVIHGDTFHQWRGTVNDVLAREILDVLATISWRPAEEPLAGSPSGDRRFNDRWLCITTDPSAAPTPADATGTGVVATPQQLHDWFECNDGEEEQATAVSARPASSGSPHGAERRRGGRS